MQFTRFFFSFSSQKLTYQVLKKFRNNLNHIILRVCCLSIVMYSFVCCYKNAYIYVKEDVRMYIHTSVTHRY